MRLLKYLITSLLIHASTSLFAQKQIIYLIPGQGSDYRIFSEIKLDTSYELRPITYWTPYPNMSMNNYAHLLAQQIDTTINFSIIGVSLGGMLATEMTTFLEPEKVIIISSAKNRHELPKRYTFQRWIPIHQIVPNRISKIGAQILQPIVEPDRKNEKETFKSMLKSKDPVFYDRTIEMIIEWDRESNPDNIIHIHGDNDHTIPHRNVDYDYLIENGSHMMTLTRSDEISTLLTKILSAQQ